MGGEDLVKSNRGNNARDERYIYEDVISQNIVHLLSYLIERYYEVIEKYKGKDDDQVV